MKLKILFPVSLFTSIFFGILPLQAIGQEDLRKVPSFYLEYLEQQKQFRRVGPAITHQLPQQVPNLEIRPFAEFEEAGTLLFSARPFDPLVKVFKAMLPHLPREVDIVVYATDPQQEAFVNEYKKLVDPSRIQTVLVQSATTNTMWARDATPLPVVGEKKHLVGARYYYSFEPDKIIASFFNLPLTEITNKFEGGNFLSDSEGNCFSLTPHFPSFADKYACKTATVLPCKHGICHIDEAAKFISQEVAVVDVPEYVNEFEKRGYKTHLLPRPRHKYGSYANSLLVNGTLFLPTFNDEKDNEAIRIYQSLGMNVIPIDASVLADYRGSIHCVTMTYPK